MVEEGKFWCHNFSLHGVGFKSLEMYFCTHNLSFNKDLLNSLSSDIQKKEESSIKLEMKKEKLQLI